MNLDLLVTNGSLTIFGIFASGFIVGILFWSLIRTLLSRLIFIGVLVFLGLFVSGNPDVQSFVSKQLSGFTKAIDGLNTVKNAFPM